MINTNLLEILRAFTPEEKQEFLLFLNSPFYVRGNNGEAMVRLFESVILISPFLKKG